MTEFNTLSPAVCGVADVSNMAISRPLDTSGSASLQGSAIDGIAELQARKTASAIADSSTPDSADIAEFREHRLNARLAGREFFAHDGQVFSIHSRYSDVVDNNPAAIPGAQDITLNAIDFATMDLPNVDNTVSTMPDDALTLPTETKAGDDPASTEILADVSDFQARRLAARLNGQEFFMHNDQQLSIYDHYIDYRVSTGEVDAKPEISELVTPGMGGISVDDSTEDLSPLPSETSAYDITV